MFRIRWFALTATIASLLCLANPLFAQRGHSGLGRGRSARTGKTSTTQQKHDAPLEQFERMSPEERQQALAQLPADRRAKLQRQLKHYDQLTPIQREQLDWFNHLPPERQDAFRKTFQKIQNEPPQRQQAMKEEVARLRAMSDAERQSRLASPEFRSRFNDNERRLLGQMSDLLPHNEN